MSRDGTQLPPHAVVMRLPKPPPDFLPDADYEPGSVTFKPSPNDEKDAEVREIPVRVSVWDTARTTTAQVIQFRDLGDKSIILEISVAVIEEHGNKTQYPLRVVEDVLPEPERSRPGADGHCGIEGLQRHPGESEKKWKDRLRGLAILTKRVPNSPVGGLSRRPC